MNTQANCTDPAAPAPSPATGRRLQARKLRQAKEAIYREHIMLMAEQVFAEKGYTDTKMQDIAGAAGISLATLYHAYKGKKELHRSLLITRDREMLECALDAVKLGLQAPETIEQVLAFTQTHLYFLLEHPDYLRILLQEGHAWYHQSAWPTRDEEQMWKRGMTLMQELFRWGMQQNLFSPGNPEHLAHLLMGLQQTQLANWVVDGMQEAQASVVQRIQANFVRLFCQPTHISRLLTDDGAGLRPDILQQINELTGNG